MISVAFFGSLPCVCVHVHVCVCGGGGGGGGLGWGSKLTGRLDRICLYCFNHWDRLVVEDEYHVFFICAKYNNIREEYLYSWYQSSESKNHFYNILSTSDHILIKKLCIYINELLKHNDPV